MEDNLSNLDSSQYKAVISSHQHILCLAGAGSGKTRVLCSRIFYLIKKRKVRPENILAITFTRNAAREMKERLAKMGIDVKNLWCRTFHSTCLAILRAQEKGNLYVLDHSQTDKLLLRCLQSLRQNKDYAYSLGCFLEKTNWPYDLFFEEVFKVIKECKSRSITPLDLVELVRGIKDEDTLEFYRLLYPVYFTYERFLKKLSCYDFSDLMNKGIRLLESQSQTRFVYQARFKHILVDEFQDINYSQAKFLTLLSGSENHLFVVGDDWQSIYGWRGGDIKYILNLEKIYQCQIITLSFNYRSDSFIVEATNKLIKKNKRQYKKKIRAKKGRENKIKIFAGQSRKEGDRFIIKMCEDYLKNNPKEKIMILGRYWRLLSPFLERFKGKRQINISTIHGAKGLEADIVFICGLYKGKGGFPFVKDDWEIMKVIRRASPGEKLEEERRCFYVAMTRAKKLLYLVTQHEQESIFLKEIPRRFCEVIRKPGISRF